MVLLVVLFSSAACADDEILSIKFSKKNQTKTALTWIQFKPQLVLAPEFSKREKRKNDARRAESILSNHEVPMALIHNTKPYSHVGKLFYTKEHGNVANCSAAFAGTDSLVVTAAHCVMSLNGDWNSDFLFIRSYGSKQQDLYAVQCIALLSTWGEASGEYILNYDYAFLKTTRVSEAGRLDITTATPPEELTIIGYSNDYNEGRTMLELAFDTSVRERQISSIDNPLGKGSSGSPWINADDSKMFSVTSHYAKSKKSVMWGPRMTTKTLRLIEYANNGCESL
jgi:V8-like Glu-specific endopeptidase